MPAKKAARKTGKKSARKPNAAFMKPLQPSAALAKVVGDRPLPRTEVVKKIWAYVKRNGLQDKKERRNINADDTLREVFGGKRTVSMFEMTKARLEADRPRRARVRTEGRRALRRFGVRPSPRPRPGVPQPRHHRGAGQPPSSRRSRRSRAGEHPVRAA